MSVTRDEAVYAYRLILGREPESEAVIQHAMMARDVSQLREAFLGSQEFVGKYDAQAAHTLPVGRFFEISDIDVDIGCTDEQLQLMFDRIATAWRSFGESEPHWSVLVSDDFRQTIWRPISTASMPRAIPT